MTNRIIVYTVRGFFFKNDVGSDLSMGRSQKCLIWNKYINFFKGLQLTLPCWHLDVNHLKVQCHEIFDLYYLAQKNSVWAPYQHRLNRFRKLFHFHEDIRFKSWKIVCLQSQWLRGHRILALGNPPCSYFYYFYFILLHTIQYK